MEPFSNRRILQQALADWRGRGRLSAEALTQAWQPTLPTRADWHDWLERALLMLGVALVCAGVIVFLLSTGPPFINSPASVCWPPR